MPKQTTLSTILRRLMFEQHIKTTELARQIGLPQATVHRIVSGASPRPHLTSLKPLADFFSVSIEQLKGQEPIESLLGATGGISPNVNMVPMIPWEQASNWQNMLKDQAKLRSILTDISINPRTFATQMTDSSMDPQFPLGTILIIDPEKEPQDRRFVLAQLKDPQQIVFRQLIIDGQNRYLKPLSPDLEQFAMNKLTDDDEICGVLVQARKDYQD